MYDLDDEGSDPMGDEDDSADEGPGPVWLDGLPGHWCRQCGCPPLPAKVLFAADLDPHDFVGLSPTNRKGMPGQLVPRAAQVPVCAPCYGALHILHRTVTRLHDPRGDLDWQDHLWNALNGLPQADGQPAARDRGDVHMA